MLHRDIDTILHRRFYNSTIYETPNADYCYFHMEILYVDIYTFVTCSMNIL